MSSGAVGLSGTGFQRQRRWFRRALLAAGLAVGLTLRIAVAQHAGHAASDWEADGFVRSWEATDFVSATRMRPPLAPWLLHGLAELTSARSIVSVRLLSVGVSLFGLLGALLLSSVLARRLRPQASDRGGAAPWIVGCWALLPTLAVGAASPTSDSLLGGLSCFAVAAAVALGSRPGALRAAVCALALLAAVLAGGIVVACAALVALLVFVAPLPPVRVALAPLLAVALALGAGWWLQRGADGERRWMPDNAPAWSLTALVDGQLVQDEREALDPDVRARVAWVTAAQGVQALGLSGVARAGSERLVGDLLNPARFQDALPLPGAAWLLGLPDLLLRGGLLALSVGVALALRPQRAPAWPRAGLAAGVLLLALGLVLTATHPFALAPLDTLLLGLAGAGFTGTQGPRRVRRRIACAACAVLLAAVGVAQLLREQPLSPWITTLYHAVHQGPALVQALADGGPDDADAEVLAANLFMDRSAPFLRMPEASLRHALRATELAPGAARATNALVGAELENLDFPEALRLADTLRDDQGALTPSGRLLVTWVHQCERDWRTADVR